MLCYNVYAIGNQLRDEWFFSSYGTWVGMTWDDLILEHCAIGSRPRYCGVINYVCIIEIESVLYQTWWLSVLLWRNLSDRGFDYCSYMITPYSYVPNKSFQSYCRHLEEQISRHHHR